MKLRNKKTGQLGNFIINKDHFECVDLDYVPEYRNLAELNEEWGDVPEEPKEYWYIDTLDIDVYRYEPGDPGEERRIEKNKEIGNYFETEEEAERAMEKLCAWKRLKDKGFKISLKKESNIGYLEANWQVLQGDYSDVDICFGGEE